MIERTKLKIQKETSAKDFDKTIWSLANKMGLPCEYPESEESVEEKNSQVKIMRVPIPERQVMATRCEVRTEIAELSLTSILHEEKRTVYLEKNVNYCEDKTIEKALDDYFVEASKMSAEDAGFEVSSEPIESDERIERMLKNIINKVTTPALPVVYIPVTNDWVLPVDVWRMAKKLACRAHVIVGFDRNRNSRLKSATNKLIQNNGIATILLPGIGKPMYFNFKNINEENAVNQIYESIGMRFKGYSDEPLSKWYDVIDYRIKNSIIEPVKITETINHEEHDEIFDKLANEADKWKEKFLESEKERKRIETELEGLKRVTESNVQNLIVRGKEEDYYPDEVKEIIIRILNEAIPRTNHRVQDILKDIVESNPTENNGEKLREEIKSIFKKDIEVNERMKNALTKLGCEVTQSGGRHYKITWKSDPRYMTIISATPSKQRTVMEEALTLISYIL